MPVSEYLRTARRAPNEVYHAPSDGIQGRPGTLLALKFLSKSWLVFPSLPRVLGDICLLMEQTSRLCQLEP